MSQTAFIENLAEMSGLGQHITEPKSPYRSGFHVDMIPKSTLNNDQQKRATKLMRILIGSLN